MQSTTKKRTPISTLNIEIGKFEYYPNVIVAEVSEGVHVTFDSALEPLQEGAKLYGYGKDFIYISHRLHSYSIDAIGYSEVANMFPNFKGLAIVATDRRRRMLAGMERLFMRKPIRVFDNLEDAFKWSEEFLEKKS